MAGALPPLRENLCTAVHLGSPCSYYLCEQTSSLSECALCSYSYCDAHLKASTHCCLQKKKLVCSDCGIDVHYVNEDEYIYEIKMRKTAMNAHKKLGECQPKEIKEEKKTLEEENNFCELTEERDSKPKFEKTIHECSATGCTVKKSTRQCLYCLKYYCPLHLLFHDCDQGPTRVNRPKLESAEEVSKRQAGVHSIKIADAIEIDFVDRKYEEEYDQDAHQSTRTTSPSSDKPQKVFKPETCDILKNVPFTDSSIPQEGKHTQSDSEYAEMCQSLSEQVELSTSEKTPKVFKPETGAIPKNVSFTDTSIPQEGKHTQSDSKYAEMCQSLSEQVELSTSEKIPKVFKPETSAIPKNVPFIDSSIPQVEKHTQSDSKYAEMCQSLSELEVEPRESAEEVSKRQAGVHSIEIADAIEMDFVDRKYEEEYDQDAHQSTRTTSPSSDKPQKVFKPETCDILKNVPFTDSSIPQEGKHTQSDLEYAEMCQSLSEQVELSTSEKTPKVFKPETGAIPKNVSFTDTSIPQEGKHTQSDSKYAEMCQSLSEQVELSTSEKIPKVFKPETSAIPKNVPFIDSSIPQVEKHTQSDSKYAEMCQSLSELEVEPRRQKHEGKSPLDLRKIIVIQIPSLEKLQSSGQIPTSEGPQLNDQIPRPEGPQSNGQIPRSEAPQSNGRDPMSEGLQSDGQIPKSEEPQSDVQITRSEGPQSDVQMTRSDRDELPIPCLPMDLININPRKSR